MPVRVKTVVVSQPLLFPWPGFFELAAQADIYVHLDDVQFSFGNFINRIQIKGVRSRSWMTIPIQGSGGKPRISSMTAAPGPWRRKHRELLRQALAGAPHLADAMALFDAAYAKDRVADLLMESFEGPARYLGLEPELVVRSSTLGVTGAGSQRILDIVRKLGGTRYLTAHGAVDYLDHEAFEQAGVTVEYADYSLSPYRQLHGEFTPYVSVLDLVANAGSAARTILAPKARPWREFLAARATRNGVM